MVNNTLKSQIVGDPKAKTRNGGKRVVNRSKQKAAVNGALMRLHPLNVGARGAVMQLQPREGLITSHYFLIIIWKIMKKIWK